MPEGEDGETETQGERSREIIISRERAIQGREGTPKPQTSEATVRPQLEETRPVDGGPLTEKPLRKVEMMGESRRSRTGTGGRTRRPTPTRGSRGTRLEAVSDGQRASSTEASGTELLGHTTDTEPTQRDGEAGLGPCTNVSTCSKGAKTVEKRGKIGGFTASHLIHVNTSLGHEGEDVLDPSPYPSELEGMEDVTARTETGEPEGDIGGRAENGSHLSTRERPPSRGGGEGDTQAPKMEGGVTLGSRPGGRRGGGEASKRGAQQDGSFNDRGGTGARGGNGQPHLKQPGIERAKIQLSSIPRGIRNSHMAVISVPQVKNGWSSGRGKEGGPRRRQHGARGGGGSPGSRSRGHWGRGGMITR